MFSGVVRWRRPARADRSIAPGLEFVCNVLCLYFIHLVYYSIREEGAHKTGSVCLLDGRSDPYSSTSTKRWRPCFGRENQRPLSCQGRAGPALCLRFGRAYPDLPIATDFVVPDLN